MHSSELGLPGENEWCRLELAASGPNQVGTMLRTNVASGKHAVDGLQDARLAQTAAIGDARLRFFVWGVSFCCGEGRSKLAAIRNTFVYVSRNCSHDNARQLA